MSGPPTPNVSSGRRPAGRPPHRAQVRAVRQQTRPARQQRGGTQPGTRSSQPKRPRRSSTVSGPSGAWPAAGRRHSPAASPALTGHCGGWPRNSGLTAQPQAGPQQARPNRRAQRAPTAGGSRHSAGLPDQPACRRLFPQLPAPKQRQFPTCVHAHVTSSDRWPQTNWYGILGCQCHMVEVLATVSVVTGHASIANRTEMDWKWSKS